MASLYRWNARGFSKPLPVAPFPPKQFWVYTLRSKTVRYSMVELVLMRESRCVVAIMEFRVAAILMKDFGTIVTCPTSDGCVRSLPTPGYSVR